MSYTIKQKYSNYFLEKKNIKNDTIKKKIVSNPNKKYELNTIDKENPFYKLNNKKISKKDLIKFIQYQLDNCYIHYYLEKRINKNIGNVKLCNDLIILIEMLNSYHINNDTTNFMLYLFFSNKLSRLLYVDLI